MEEKKLTDEELDKLIKALEYQSWAQNSPELSQAAYMLKYQKAEIERLTEENKQLEEEIDLEVDLQTQRKRQIIAESQEFIDELANKNAELQKQVDEWNSAFIPTRARQQAVKDTAKEILAKAPTETNPDEMFIHWLRERYGVEVE